jgi:hypothetical protein
VLWSGERLPATLFFRDRFPRRACSKRLPGSLFLVPIRVNECLGISTTNASLENEFQRKKNNKNIPHIFLVYPAVVVIAIPFPRHIIAGTTLNHVDKTLLSNKKSKLRVLWRICPFQRLESRLSHIRPLRQILRLH